MNFVKGHCGWDTLTLLLEGEISPDHELEAALKIMDPPVSGGIEVGFLGKTTRPHVISLRAADSTTRDWIPMCGGMTQVIGKALVETFFRDHFGIDRSSPRIAVTLETVAGTIPLHVEVVDGRADRVTTHMDAHAAYLYKEGVEPVTLQGCEVLRVGEFLVIDVETLERRHPGLDFTRRDFGEHLDVVNEILNEHRWSRLEASAVAMMYDRRPDGAGSFRLYPRFYGADLSAARIPYEFQCGTGTVAVGVALAHARLLPFAGNRGRVTFEWGNHLVTPDPYGIRTSTLDVTLSGGRVARVSFSHSVVEILQEGRMTLPSYRRLPQT